MSWVARVTALIERKPGLLEAAVAALVLEPTAAGAGLVAPHLVAVGDHPAVVRRRRTRGGAGPLRRALDDVADPRRGRGEHAATGGRRGGRRPRGGAGALGGPGQSGAR